MTILVLTSEDTKSNSLQKEYLNKLSKAVVIGFPLSGTKKYPEKLCKQFINEVIKEELTGITHILVLDATYFKVLSKVSPASAYVGYCITSDLGVKVVYAPSCKSFFYDPTKTRELADKAIQAIINDLNGQYQEPGTGIIHSAKYLKQENIKTELAKLLHTDLTIDIETFSLKHHNSGIGSICFCWSQHEGLAFKVDSDKETRNHKVRDILRWFFENHTGKRIFHNITFDMYILTYQLYMKGILDRVGMLKGFEVLLRNWEDTKLIAYLALNSCSRPELGLKVLSQPFAGNYALKEITDISKVGDKELLEYNLIDGLSTWYVFNTYYPIMVQDNQLDFYNTIFRHAVPNIIEMQLVGLPININTVHKVKNQLSEEEAVLSKAIAEYAVKCGFVHKLQVDWVTKKNSELVKKRVTLQDAQHITFNSSSGDQRSKLLYEYLKLPILDRTESGSPSTDKKAIASLKNHTEDKEIKILLDNILELSKIEKLLSTYIPVFEEAVKAEDGWHYVFGNYNLGGTVSCRLSSSDPNMQNLPSSGKLGKLIKSCFEAPEGYIFCGIDYNGLEDRISALTTKDPNKLKVYTDGYDGHSLRAFTYFGNKMPDIEVAKENVICYRAIINNKDVYFHEEEEIEYLGKLIKGKELYELLTNTRI